MILFNFYFKMITKEAAYKKITELVERFEEQFASYKNQTITKHLPAVILSTLFQSIGLGY